MNAAESLAAYVLADTSDMQFVEECAAAAEQIVTNKIGTAKVPDQVKRAATLEVGANLFNRRAGARDSATGIDADTTPAFFRPSLDPITPAWPLLRPYLQTTGIA